MAVTMMSQDLEGSLSNFAAPEESCAISELGRHDTLEVMEFLSARPLHTAYLAGLIRDNGLLSPQNSGSFYGSRNRMGQLEGVALIGHATMVEAHTESSLIALARVARNCQNAHLIRGEQKSMSTFWQYYSDAGQEPRQICRQLLNSRAPSIARRQRGLRPATANDLEKVLAVNSAMAFGRVAPAAEARPEWVSESHDPALKTASLGMVRRQSSHLQSRCGQPDA